MGEIMKPKYKEQVKTTKKKRYNHKKHEEVSERIREYFKTLGVGQML